MTYYVVTLHNSGGLEIYRERAETMEDAKALIRGEILLYGLEGGDTIKVWELQG